MPFEVKPLANVGVEVIGFDLREPITEAARLGYAAWNLDKAVPRQLAEAETRKEIDAEARLRVEQVALTAAQACRDARSLLLKEQPRLPNEKTLGGARTSVQQCRLELQKALASL